MPALDFDSSGNIVSTFYDRRKDTNNIQYRLYRAYINADGVKLAANRDLSQFSSTPGANWNYPGFLGDYHELWNTDINGVSTWISSWIGVSTVSKPDVYLSSFSP